MYCIYQQVISDTEISVTETVLIYMLTTVFLYGGKSSTKILT